jgi:Flp pilus assembly protein TadG
MNTSALRAIARKEFIQIRRDKATIYMVLIFPVMMLVMIAVFDLGRLVFSYNNITNAARTSVRVAIVDQTGTVARDAAINQATSLGLTASNVTVAYRTADLSAACPTAKTLDCVAEVTVTYTWSAITPLIGNLVGPMTVTAISREPIERIYP